MWLRDYLREDLPQLRTMTYGYNSNLQAHNVDTIMDYGLGFMEEIKKVRKTEDVRFFLIFAIERPYD
jgi:CMP-2-keto-3-deoxyoctulosonic acid synthetase